MVGGLDEAPTVDIVLGVNARGTALQAASLTGLVRGYEDVKWAGVESYRAAQANLIHQLRAQSHASTSAV